MFNKLENINISLCENKKNILNSYIDLFLKYNQKVNLISKNDEKYLFEKHIYDSLMLSKFFEKYQIPKNILDIGTGGGFPSLPLAICFPEINVLAVDSISKKIRFILSAKTNLNIKNIQAKASRVEELPWEYKNSFDLVTSRAMAQLRIILEYAIPYVKTGGYFAAYKSLKADEEIIEAENALKVLNTKLIDKIEYNLPIEENPKRVLLIFKKLKQVDSTYPRKNGVLKKNPL